MDQIHTHMRPLLMMLGDYRSLTLNVVNRLTSVTRLFPNSFNDKFCDQMMVRNYTVCPPPQHSNYHGINMENVAVKTFLTVVFILRLQL